MAAIEREQLRAFLETAGHRQPVPAQLVLLGGGALCLLGSARPTLDVDYVGDDLHADALHAVLEAVAHEMHLELEAVPIERFVPIPPGSDQRRLTLGRFGNLEVFALDPYVIALSKLDRGFDTDLEDIVFLIRRGLVDAPELERQMDAALLQARTFDILLSEMRAHWQTLRAMLAGD